jgi:hypothetical protein
MPAVCDLRLFSRAMAKQRQQVFKLKLDEESEALLRAAGVGLDELAKLLVFGRRRRTRRGTEIFFDQPPADAALAAQLTPLEGLSLLVVGGCIRECSRTDRPSDSRNSSQNKEKTDVRSTVREKRKRR